MIRKLALAFAATLAVGASTLATIDDASAARAGMSRGSVARTGSTGFRRTAVARPAAISRRPNAGRPGVNRRPNLGRRPVSVRPGHQRFGSHGSHQRYGSHGRHHRYGSFGRHHRHGSFTRFHRRGFSWGTYVTYGGAPVVYGAPARAVPASAPVCDSCGGWTKNGCYMTYRKVVDQNGQPTLKCVEACDEQEPQQQGS